MQTKAFFQNQRFGQSSEKKAFGSPQLKHTQTGDPRHQTMIVN